MATDGYELFQSFYIDTDGYTDRDREMFVCGVEFQMILEFLRDLSQDINRPIHRENESRVRMLCGKRGLRYAIEPHTGYEGCETWSNLTIGA